MTEVQKSMRESGGRNGAIRFLKAWELAASREEGVQKGRLTEGRLAVLRVARLRFGEVAEELTPCLERIRTLAGLEELHKSATLTQTFGPLVKRAGAMTDEEARHQKRA